MESIMFPLNSMGCSNTVMLAGNYWVTLVWVRHRCSICYQSRLNQVYIIPKY